MIFHLSLKNNKTVKNKENMHYFLDIRYCALDSSEKDTMLCNGCPIQDKNKRMDSTEDLFMLHVLNIMENTFT